MQPQPVQASELSISPVLFTYRTNAISPSPTVQGDRKCHAKAKPRYLQARHFHYTIHHMHTANLIFFTTKLTAPNKTRIISRMNNNKAPAHTPMLQLIRELFSLLTPAQRKRFCILQVLVILMAFAEIAGVAAIGPFMLLVADIDVLHGDGRMAQIYQWSGLASSSEFVFWAGAAVLAVLCISSVISMITTWQLALFSNRIGAELGTRLYQYYLHQPWLFHAQQSSSLLTKKIATETGRITNQILTPLMQMNSRIALALFMSLAVFLFNPVVAIAGLIIFGCAYLLLFRVVRRRLTRHGRRVSEQNGQRFKLMSEGFGGIKDVLLLNRQALFIQRFQATSRKLAHSQGTNQTLAMAPRYLMEMVAFGSMIFLVLFLLYSHEGNMRTILPSLAIYGLAGFKLMPAFQNIYQNIAKIKGGLPAYEAIKADLKASQAMPLNTHASELPEPIIPADTIELKNISFTYPGKQQPVLDNLTMQIKANSVVGIVGSSGAGKSTVIDVLMGLITPQQGQLLVDGEPVSDKLLENWQQAIGFVPQSIFLADASITENIAFGIPDALIDEAKVKTAASLAHLDKLLQELPQGLDTFVGERGVQLSGGQRQRIGIARALYHDASVLVLDEATSSLDGITEKLIMDAIHDFSGRKTIVMIAHRLKTVQACDTIFFMDKGRVVDQGSYDELIQRNPQFEKMAHHA